MKSTVIDNVEDDFLHRIVKGRSVEGMKGDVGADVVFGEIFAKSYKFIRTVIYSVYGVVEAARKSMAGPGVGGYAAEPLVPDYLCIPEVIKGFPEGGETAGDGLVCYRRPCLEQVLADAPVGPGVVCGELEQVHGVGRVLKRERSEFAVDERQLHYLPEIPFTGGVLECLCMPGMVHVAAYGTDELHVDELFGNPFGVGSIVAAE